MRRSIDPRAFLRGDLVRSTATLVGGTGAAQLIVIATSPIITRLYTPSDYGVYSVAVAILIITAVTCLKYELAIPLPHDDVDAANVVGVALLANLAMSAATALVLLVLGPWLLAQLGAAELGPYIMLLALAQLGSGVVTTFTYWAIRTKEFKAIAGNRITQSGTLVAVQIGLGVAGLGAAGLVIGTVAGSIAGSTRLVRSAFRTHADALRRMSRAGVVAAAKQYRRFPIFSTWSTLLAHLGVRAPLILLVAFYGPAIGGQYALAERITQLPLNLVAGAVGQVFVADASRVARSQPGDLRRLFRRTTWNLARVAVLPAVVVAITAPFVIGLVFGPDWELAGQFVSLMVPMYFAAFVMTATGDVLYILERQELHLMREVLRITLLGGSVVVAALVGLPPLGVVAAFSAAGCVMYVLYGAISWWAIVTYRPRDLRLTPAEDETITDQGGPAW